MQSLKIMQVHPEKRAQAIDDMKSLILSCKENKKPFPTNKEFADLCSVSEKCIWHYRKIISAQTKQTLLDRFEIEKVQSIEDTLDILEKNIIWYKEIQKNEEQDIDIRISAAKLIEEAMKHKIKDLVKVLNRYQFKSKLYLVPYHVYQFHTMDNNIQDDLVLFRHYLFKITEKIAENGYQAIVTGDNLGQVASQTVENMRASEYGVTLPVFRPLLTFDKHLWI